MTDIAISRKSLLWLLGAQFLVIAPHVLNAPLWIWLVWAVVVFWRWQIFKEAWGYPGKAVKTFLLLVCCVGLFFSFGGKLGTSGMVSLLLTGFTLKLIELRKRRDCLLVCYLGYLVIATQFLFYNSIGAALYGILCIFVLTHTLLTFSQSRFDKAFYSGLRNTGVIMLQALPIMLLLFLVMPRFGPFWSVPLDTSTARTGMSDSLAPGELANLMRSSEPAFRVTFDGETPGVASMYWRGLVFSEFDGVRWSQSAAQRNSGLISFGQAEADPSLAVFGEPLAYQVILEPTQQNWLFALSAPVQWSARVGITPELNLRWRTPISQRIQYQVTSHRDYQFEAAGLSDRQRVDELRFPAKANPITVETAKRWRAEAANDHEYVARVLKYFTDEFSYTLRPGTLGENPVDDFLWQTRAGFCEHFASAFTLMMRVGGIPARIVTGYQGGERNASENYWLIRQRDAHAWAEVWFEGQGWVTVDPTAAVAPDRIEQGIDFSLDEDDTRMLGNSWSRQFAFLNTLRMQMDALNFQWSRWVLNYDRTRQMAFLQALAAGFSWLWLVTIIVLIALPILIWIGYQRYVRLMQIHPADRWYQRMERKLERAGMKREAGETARGFYERVSVLKPALKADMENITRLYEHIRYGEDEEKLVELQVAVGRFTVN